MEQTKIQENQTSSFMYIQPNFDKNPNLLSSSSSEEFNVFLFYLSFEEFD
jgi:hypothetical protein